MSEPLPETASALEPAEQLDPPTFPGSPRTRRAPRFKLASNVCASIGGKSVTLVDVSRLGAQVVSTSSLRPGQHVRMVLPGESGPPLACSVIWAVFELVSEKPRFRAGIEFRSADPALMDAFIRQHREI